LPTKKNTNRLKYPSYKPHVPK